MHFDVGIIGGGPAGSAMGSYLAKAGISCVILERELFPRPHVGESLVPAANRVLDQIGFIDKMDEAGFPRKFGAAWTVHDSPLAKSYSTDWVVEGKNLQAHDRVDISFSERPQQGIKDYTWHVDRGKFDNLLLQHAASLGATVYEGIRVRRVDFLDDRARMVFELGAQESHIDVKMVVDASGRDTFLGKQLQHKVIDPVFKQMAMHTWFDNFDRSAASGRGNDPDFIFIHFIPLTNTWVWQIPITDTVTSVGVVCQKGSVPKRKEDREAYFWECLKTRPRLYEALRSAKQVTPMKEEGDYSYAMREVCGDRFVLAGDAARFVDPIFSSGVSVALNSARLASSAIVRAVQTGDFSKQSFGDYEAVLRRGVRNWYKFISLYYRLNVLFTHFVGNPRWRLDVLKLLQGDVYEDDEPEVLAAMEAAVKEVEGDPKHPWHNALGKLSAEELRSAF